MTNGLQRRFIARILQRVAILSLGLLSIWLIVFVFRWVDGSLPWILALSVTYGLAAYVILPRAVRMGLKILQRRRVQVSRLPRTGFRVIPSISP